jgi:hypothetical protein
MVRLDSLSFIVTVWDHIRQVRGNVWLRQRLRLFRH